MNFRLLGKILGMLLLLLSITMCICLAFSYFDQERKPGLDAVEAFAISTSLTAGSGILLVLLGRNSGREILRREAIAIVGLGWILCAIYGALPYVYCEPRLSFADAFFESMSGFTTTGSTVIGDLTRFPRGILLWRSFSQWLGGMGILVLFVALLSYLGVGSKAIFRHESSAKHGGGVQTRIRDVAMILWKIYLGMSVICCAGLMALGMDLYNAICHTFTTLSTGGFSPHNESIAYFNSVWIELWLILFMILSGASFMLYAWLLRGHWDRWKHEEETKFFLGILLGFTVMITINLLARDPQEHFLHALRAAAFQVASIMTTTGFATEDFDQWPIFSKILLLLMMMIGGCAGSTAGGIKISRWLLFFKTIRMELVAAFRPNKMFSLRLNGRIADDSLKLQTAFFISIAGVTVAFGSALVSLMEPELQVAGCVSSVLATLFNIGPGLGGVGPTHTFAVLGAPTKIFLSLLMALGRLEFFAILVLFLPSLWKKY